MKPILALIPLLVVSACSILPDRHTPADSLQEETDRVAGVMSEIRRLPELEPVRAREATDQRARLDVQAALNRTWTDESLGVERALKAFTLVPPDMNLREWYGAFLAENGDQPVRAGAGTRCCCWRIGATTTGTPDVLEDPAAPLSLFDAPDHAERIGRRVPREADLAMELTRALSNQEFGLERGRADLVGERRAARSGRPGAGQRDVGRRRLHARHVRRADVRREPDPPHLRRHGGGADPPGAVRRQPTDRRLRRSAGAAHQPHVPVPAGHEPRDEDPRRVWLDRGRTRRSATRPSRRSRSSTPSGTSTAATARSRCGSPPRRPAGRRSTRGRSAC